MIVILTRKLNNITCKAVLFCCIALMAVAVDTTMDRQLTIRLLILAVCVTITIRKIPRSNIMLLFLGFLLCSVISLARAINPTEGLFDIARIIVAIFAICAFSGRDFKRAIVYTAIIMSLYGIFASGPWVYISGSMDCRNQWAQALVLVLPFCVFFYKKSKLLSITSSLLVLYNIYMLHNRTSILAVGVGCLVLALTSKRFRWLAIGSVIVAVMLFHENAVSLDVRFEYWRASLDMAKDNLLFGVGAGNWQYEMIEYYGNLPTSPNMITGQTVLLRPHNDFILVLCETGVVGLLYYVGILAAGIYYAIKQKNRLVLFGIAMFCTISFFSFPKERPFLFLMLVLYLSLLKFESFNRRLLVLASTAIMIIVCSYLSIYHLTERRIAKVKLLTKQLRWSEVITETEKCSRWNPNTMAMIPVAWYKSNAYLHQRDYGKAINENDIAYKDNPNCIYVLDRMGCFLRLMGMNDRADRCFDRVEEMVPKFKASR